MTLFPQFQQIPNSNEESKGEIIVRPSKPKHEQKSKQIRTGHRYKHGFHWCGKCGQWYKVPEPKKEGNRCPDCNYMLRHDALLKGQRRPWEVHRY